jgi:CO/xanthine dehydrogenase Mo-binding subunit
MQSLESASYGIGQPVRRKEDFRLLTGRGCFVDDLAPPGLAHVVFVRSPHAHARIATVDATRARAAPGVLAVLTGADYRADGLGPIAHLAASFMDHPMPRADTLPALATALSEVPAPSNRLGVRSGGEGGTTPALAVVINAIVDALAELGVHHIEMPATPERVWRAIREASGQRIV